MCATPTGRDPAMTFAVLPEPGLPARVDAVSPDADGLAAVVARVAEQVRAATAARGVVVSRHA